MSSWLVSLRWIGGRICWTCRILVIRGLRASCFCNRFFEVTPGRLGAEARSQICQQCRNLAIVHDGGKPRHDGAALAFDGPHARKHDIGKVARVVGIDRGAEAKMDAAIGRWAAALMAA